MNPLPAVSDVRAAYCTICDPASFLRNLRQVAARHNTHIICFNADQLAGRIHAATAVARAVRAFDEGMTISNTLEMEALLYAAGSRQCNIAASFGIHEGKNRVYICCFPAHPEVWAALEPLFSFDLESRDTIDHSKSVRLMELFGISEGEMIAAGGDDRIVDLVLERVALLQVTR
ncbi:MAG TPA: KEOPS complex subunit Cgi121 [Methanoregula sp.]|nr:KEOPS complex subunit Cgi121 [Methanoregula sp.]